MSSSGDIENVAKVDEKRSEKIRFQPPDIIVSVGSRDSKQDFECYGVLLSYASEYLDAMLSSGMKEGTIGKIEFPTRFPKNGNSSTNISTHNR